MEDGIKLYNLTRTGGLQDILISKSAFKPNRLLAFLDPYKKRIYLIYGTKINSEVMRLKDYAIEDLNNELNYKIIEVKNEDEIKQLKATIFDLKKNPPSDPNKIIFQEISSEEIITSESVNQARSKDTELGRKIFPVQPTRTILVKTKDTVPKPFIKSDYLEETAYRLKGDEDEGPIMDEFGISFYESTENGNHENVLTITIDPIAREWLIEHVSLINSVLRDKPSKTHAKKILRGSIYELLDELWKEQ